MTSPQLACAGLGRQSMPSNPREGNMLYVICGLGNPGRRYAMNRHNAGFHCVDLLAARWTMQFNRMRFKAYISIGRFADTKAILAKPLTFMNVSGQAVSPLLNYYKVPTSQLLVIYDDLDLELGRIRLRPNGTAGGHKGMLSIIRQLGRNDFSRLRIGIGRPEHGEPYRYVLSDFSPEQQTVMDKAYERSADAVECFLQEGVEAAMNRYNG